MASYAPLGGEENNVSVNVGSSKTMNTFKIDSEADNVQLLDESQQTKELNCWGKFARFLSNHLKSIVFGGTDGTVTSFTIVAGSIAMGLSGAVVLALGFVSIIGDGLGMAAGDYISSLTEDNFAAETRKKVEQADSDDLTISLAKTFREKGATVDDSMAMAKLMQKTPALLCDTVLATEHHLLTNSGEADESPLLGGLVTFCSFTFFGIIPLLAFIFDSSAPGGAFGVAIVLTLLSFTLLGVLQGKLVSTTTWAAIQSALKLIFVGCLAAGAAYSVGLICDAAGAK